MEAQSAQTESPGLCEQNAHPENQSSAVKSRLRAYALRLLRTSHQAINQRCFLAVTLFRNPSLVKYRGVPEKPKNDMFLLKMKTMDPLHRSNLDDFIFK